MNTQRLIFFVVVLAALGSLYYANLGVSKLRGDVRAANAQEKISPQLEEVVVQLKRIADAEERIANAIDRSKTSAKWFR